MKSVIVKVRAYAQRFWVEILDILPGLESPAFRARVDNDVDAMPLKYGDIIYIAGGDIIDVYGSGSAKKTKYENKQKILSELISRLPGYEGLPQYHGWPLIKMEYDDDGRLTIVPTPNGQQSNSVQMISTPQPGPATPIINNQRLVSNATFVAVKDLRGVN